MQRISERKMNLANVNVRKVNTGGNTRHEARIQTYRVDHGCGYCMRVGLMYLRRKESYTNSFSNGNSGPEIVELNAKIRAWYRPYGWTARRLLITSGLIRVVTVTTVHIHRTSGCQNKPLRHMVAEPVSDISPDAKLPHLRWCSRKDGPAMINTRSSTSHAMTDHQKTVFGPM
jgi:hypothetical protein